MPSTEDRRSWFGLSGRPSLPAFLRTDRGKRLKGLDEFETPEFVGRMDRVARRKRLGWWAMMAAGFALGGAIGWGLI